MEDRLVVSSTRPSAFASTLAPVFLVACGGCVPPGPGDVEAHSEPLRLDQIQVLGSHNSYKLAIEPNLLSLLAARRPEVAASLDYAHPPLAEQLDGGLRKLELDVFHDPEGGLYADPSGPRQVSAAGLDPGPPHDPAGELLAPGFKLLPVQDIDYRSSCLTLASCLAELRAWSDENPGHLPIVVTLNAKDAPIVGDDGEPEPAYVVPLPFDTAAFAALDAEIVESLGRDRLLLPDDVRGDSETLEEAVLRRGWPAVGEVRGRFLFVLDEGGGKLETYVEGHPSLRGRVLFVNAEPGRPEAAFRIVNDPIGRGEEIRELVRRGYLVRTRADADTREARSGETARRDAAFATGAHFVSTDYAFGSPFGTGYRVSLPGGGVVRCNPVTAQSGCQLAE